MYVLEMYIVKLIYEICVREFLLFVLLWEIKMVYLIGVCIYIFLIEMNF